MSASFEAISMLAAIVGTVAATCSGSDVETASAPSDTSKVRITSPIETVSRIDTYISVTFPDKLLGTSRTVFSDSRERIS